MHTLLLCVYKFSPSTNWAIHSLACALLEAPRGVLAGRVRCCLVIAIVVYRCKAMGVPSPALEISTASPTAWMLIITRLASALSRGMSSTQTLQEQHFLLPQLLFWSCIGWVWNACVLCPGRRQTCDFSFQTYLLTPFPNTSKQTLVSTREHKKLQEWTRLYCTGLVTPFSGQTIWGRKNNTHLQSNASLILFPHVRSYLK